MMPGAAILAAGRGVVLRLQQAGAGSPGSARTHEDLRRLHRARLEHLVDEGVVRRMAGDRSYLDRTAWAEHRAVQRRLALLLAGFAALAMVVGVLVAQSG